MGIPAFYRWLVERYPRAAVSVIEDEPPLLDTTGPNPNGYEFDNLYLDMNGIVHPCFHPEGLPPPKSYDDVFRAVFNYIDRIFSIVRPRKLLFLAIDGVAPRAKMNQQRSRRFRAAKDAADEASWRESKIESEGEKSASLEQSKKLDSNVITPGTEFMALLSSSLHYYIRLRMNRDAGWQGIKVILSDANVPGEGEHKIMSYIRLQRNLPGYDPNTRHCLYGLDADLIMLALATHEIHFSILREDVRGAGPNDKTVKCAKDSLLVSQQGEREYPKQMKVVDENVEDYVSRQKFQFLNIWVLREYLAIDMKVKGFKKKAKLECLVDDFVFMCLFIGNDFLPHIPSLEISEGAIDLLMMVYKKEFVKMGGYLTNSSKVNLERVEHFVQAVGSHECAIFRRRTQMEKERELRFRRFSRNKLISYSSKPMSQKPPNSSAADIQTQMHCIDTGTNANVDKIKLGEKGWKERFYAEKFEAQTEDECERILRNAVSKYIEGMCWVMHYYYEGVCSWQWFYPYHYAPFASDFHGIDKLNIEFTLGKPLKPFDQLLGVLPAASAHALPLFYRELMTDMSSPLLDFYPTDFKLDMNGKRFSWQAICKLPFIEESRLLSEIAKVEHTLTDEERQRNSFSVDALFVHTSHPLAVEILAFCKRKVGHPKLPNAKVKRKINPKFSGGMNGYMYISEQPVQPAEIHSPIEGMEMIANNDVLSVLFRCPPFHSHIPRLLNGVKLPLKSVRKQDILPSPILWHEKSAVLGRIFSERSIHKSISGHRLAELSHQLLSKCYHLKSQKSGGSLQLGEPIDTHGLTSHLNLEQTLHVGETGGSENRIDGGIPTNHSGGDELACHLNLEEMVCMHRTEGDKNCLDSMPGLADNCVGNAGLTCSNLEETVAVCEAGSDKVCINARSRKRRRKRSKVRNTLENDVGAEKLVWSSNLEPTAGMLRIEADNIPGFNGVPDTHVGETGGHGLACTDVIPDKNTVDRKSRKQKRKQKQGKVVIVPYNDVGAEKSACPLNLEPTAGMVRIEADNISGCNGVPDTHVGETGGHGLACTHVIPDKNTVDRKSRKRKRKQKQGKVVIVPYNDVGAEKSACPLNLEPTAGMVRIEADNISGCNGVPDTHVGETGGHGLACTHVIPDKNTVDRKSRKRKRKQKQGKVVIVPYNDVGAEKSACPLNLEPTAGMVRFEADKTSGCNVVPDTHVGETGAHGLACTDVIPDKNTVGNVVPNDHAREIGAIELASANGVLDKSSVDGKSRRWKQRKVRCALNDDVGAEGLACTSNLGIAVSEVGSRADNNCAHGGVLENHVVEAGANGLSCGCGVPDKGCVD